MTQKYSSQLVKLLLTSIDDVEMRRLKEGFYGIMKLSNHVNDKPDFKNQLIEHSKIKIEKPQTEAILKFYSNLDYNSEAFKINNDSQIVQVNDIQIGIDFAESNLNRILNNDAAMQSQDSSQKTSSAGFKMKNLTIGGNRAEVANNSNDINQDHNQRKNKNEEVEVELKVQEEIKMPTYKPGQQRAKQKGKKQMAPPSFMKKLQLKVGGGDGEKDEEEGPSTTLQLENNIQVELKETKQTPDGQILADQKNLIQNEQIMHQNQNIIVYVQTSQIQQVNQQTDQQIEDTKTEQQKEEIKEQAHFQSITRRSLDQNISVQTSMLIHDSQQSIQVNNPNTPDSILFTDHTLKDLQHTYPMMIDTIRSSESQYQEKVMIANPLKRYSTLEQRTIILSSIINRSLLHKTYQRTLNTLLNYTQRQLSTKTNQESQNIKKNQSQALFKKNVGGKKLMQLFYRRNLSFKKEFFIRLRALMIVSFADNPPIFDLNQLNQEQIKQVKLVQLLSQHQPKGFWRRRPINLSSYFNKWQYQTIITKIKTEKGFQNQKKQDKIKQEQSIRIRNQTFQQLAFRNEDNDNYKFDEKNVKFIKFLSLLNDMQISRQKEAFELIKFNDDIKIKNHLMQIENVLNNLDEYMSVISQNNTNQNDREAYQYFLEDSVTSSNKHQNQDRIGLEFNIDQSQNKNLDQSRENQESVQNFKKNLKEIKGLYELYKKMSESAPPKMILQKIDYQENLVTHKLKSAFKIASIINKKTYIDKAVLRRMRIWHSKDLRDRMKILTKSLDKSQWEERHINLMILWQITKKVLQFYFYLWQENIFKCDSFTQKSLMSATSSAQQQLSSTNNIRSTTSSALNHRVTPQSHSIDETSSKGKGGGSIFITSSAKRQQQKLIMGSFDLDQRQQNQTNQSIMIPPQNLYLKQIGHHKNRQGMSSSINNSSLVGYKSIIKNQNATTISIHNPIFDTMDRQNILDVKAKSLFQLSKILLQRSQQTKISNYIKTITTISNQPLKYRKTYMQSQEVMNLIQDSYHYILKTAIHKWIITAHFIGRKNLDKQQGITRMFNVLQKNNKLQMFDALFRLYKYWQEIVSKAGDINAKTKLVHKFSNIFLAIQILQKRQSRKDYISKIHSFQQWKFQITFSNQRKSILENSFQSINKSLSEVFTPKRQNMIKLPYEDPLMKEKLKNLSIVSGSLSLNNILDRPSQVKEINANVEKLEIQRAFNIWFSVLAQEKLKNQINSKLNTKKDLKIKILKRLQQQLSRTINRQMNCSFQKWRFFTISRSEQESGDLKFVEAVDQSIIQVQAQVGQDLERQYIKQSNQVKIIKHQKLIVRLIDIYESNMEVDLQVKNFFDLWVRQTGVRMEFGRVSKYLKEIDISNNEKRELEQKMSQLNEENEVIQHRMKNHTLSTACETCRQLMSNKAMMISQQQNERRQQVWDLYSQNQESEVYRVEDGDGMNGSQWNESSFDNIRRLTSDDGKGSMIISSRNLTGRSGKMISTRNIDKTSQNKNLKVNDQVRIEVHDDNASGSIRRIDDTESQIEIKDDQPNHNDLQEYNENPDSSDQQSSFIMRLQSNQDMSSFPNSSKNASIKFFGGAQGLGSVKGVHEGKSLQAAQNQVQSSSHQNLFNQNQHFDNDNYQEDEQLDENQFDKLEVMVKNANQRPRVNTQIKRIYVYPDETSELILRQDQATTDDKAISQSNNGSTSTQMIKIDAQSQFSINTQSQKNIFQNSTQGLKQIRENDQRSYNSRQSIKGFQQANSQSAQKMLLNPHQNQYLREISNGSGGGASDLNITSDQLQMQNANNFLMFKAATARRVTLGSAAKKNTGNNLHQQSSSQSGTNQGNSYITEMRRLSSYKAFSDQPTGQSNAQSFIMHGGQNNFNRRFSKYSETGTVIEQADPEQFGNDLVLQLEQENCELRFKEEQLKQQLQRQMIDHMHEKEQMLRRLRELEIMRSQLKANASGAPPPTNHKMSTGMDNSQSNNISGFTLNDNNYNNYGLNYSGFNAVADRSGNSFGLGVGQYESSYLKDNNYNQIQGQLNYNNIQDGFEDNSSNSDHQI